MVIILCPFTCTWHLQKPMREVHSTYNVKITQDSITEEAQQQLKAEESGPAQRTSTGLSVRRQNPGHGVNVTSKDSIFSAWARSHHLWDILILVITICLECSCLSCSLTGGPGQQEHSPMPSDSSQHLPAYVEISTCFSPCLPGTKTSQGVSCEVYPHWHTDS